MKKVYFATKADVERLHSFFGQANKKDDKINELYAQFMILEEAEEIRAVIGYEQSEEHALIRSCLFTPNVDKQTFLLFFRNVFAVYERKKYSTIVLTNKSSTIYNNLSSFLTLLL